MKWTVLLYRGACELYEHVVLHLGPILQLTDDGQNEYVTQHIKRYSLR